MRALLDDAESVEIPLAPLIDVVFLLLIFFLVATTFVRRELDAKVRLPRSEAGTAPVKAEILVLNVRADGTVVIDGRVMETAGVRERLRDWAAGGDRPVAIRADAAAPYERVMKVMGWCRTAGVEKVDLPVEKEESDAEMTAPRP